MAVTAPELYAVSLSTSTYSEVSRPHHITGGGSWPEFPILIEPSSTGGMIWSGYRLVKPLTTRISSDDVCFVASDDISSVFGAGATPREALEDYARSMSEQLAWFHANERDLGPGLAEEAHRLRQVFVPLD